ncbi:transporter substrate-binding domain-containing protein [Marinobacter sp. CHS3-4]|uniref:substrate-binding periplasmic protein n=1 Tax=Marinobacter sp. CHS3-4 TaxID=3045174 RepID=UPI0024B5BC66|nr:transporter substrate-binding domain-containing protein [Marinobacter sp. CHS3-4]MDI9245391.1 transporter substrate-binding domain-containing protein [Marinobacter sp. CHS3-4]
MTVRTITAFWMLMLCLCAPVAADNKIVLASGDWPPYLGEQYPDGGFAARIITEAFELEGIEVEYIYLPWSRALASVRTPEVQASAVWSCTESRAVDYLYSAPLLPYQYVFYHRADMAFDWDSLSDLQGLSVGLTQDYSYGEILSAAIEDGVIFGDVTTSDSANFKKLLLGRIDLFPMDPVVGEAMINEEFRPQADKLTFHPKPLRRAFYHLVFDRESETAPQLIERFNRGLQTLRQNGRYEEIIGNALSKSSQPEAALILRQSLVDWDSGTESGICNDS